MGADLYIADIIKVAREKYEPLFFEAVERRNDAKTDAEKEKIQEEVDKYYDALHPEDGYFQDPYDKRSVLWSLGLSWWEDCKNLLDSEGHLSGENLSTFIRLVEEAEQNLPTREQLDDDENSVEAWHKHYVERRETLLKFLKGAQKNKQAIRCSV